MHTIRLLVLTRPLMSIRAVSSTEWLTGILVGDRSHSEAVSLPGNCLVLLWGKTQFGKNFWMPPVTYPPEQENFPLLSQQKPS